MVGIPGVGKTTLVKKLVELLQAKKHSVRVESFGTLMLKEAADYVKNRDDLRRLDILQQKKLQNKVASKIASFDEDIVLVDTHAFIATDSGFYPGLPNNILEINPKLHPCHHAIAYGQHLFYVIHQVFPPVDPRYGIACHYRASSIVCLCKFFINAPIVFVVFRAYF